MKSRVLSYRSCATVVLTMVIAASAYAADDPASKSDPRYPFRTDFANSNLPWYQPKPGEFPPHHSDHRVSGELVSADFIHRTGQFRTTKPGELMDFVMPPYGAVNYLNAEADLRDLPLGTYFLFFLNQDAHGSFTRLATMQDQFTMDAGHGFSYRLDDTKLAEGKLFVTRRKLAKTPTEVEKKELFVTEQTRVWKGDKHVKLADLVVGDELLFNLTGRTVDSPGRCTDIWVGVDTHKLATEQQRQKFTTFVKFRGLPGWIDKVDGDKLTVTLFTGSSATFKQTWLDELAVGKEIKTVVANDELRTWNPPVDNERGTILEVKTGPTAAYGTSGVTLTFTVAHLLEGFRKGRIVRVFAGGWKLKDQFYGESLMGYGYGRLGDPELVELTPKEYPTQFPFRTDYGNEHLPWFQLVPGAAPPRFSEHRVLGELVKADAKTRTGQFRVDRTGELVNFTVIPEGSIAYLNADADLSEIPLGTRCRFKLYQDEMGEFTRASSVSDEFSFMAQRTVTYRVEAIKLEQGKFFVACQLPLVKNYNGDMEQPPAVARAELRFNSDTRVWKGSQQVKLTDLAVGDVILVNMSGEQPDNPSHCTEIWVGADTLQLVSEQQRKKHPAAKKK